MARFALLSSEKLKEYELGHVLTQDQYENFMELFQKKLGQHPDFDLASIAGVTGVDYEMAEPQPIPEKIKPDRGLPETQEIVGLIRAQLSGYWRCFSS